MHPMLKPTCALLVLICMQPNIAYAKECPADNTIDYSRAIQNSQKAVRAYMKDKHIVGLTIALSVCDKLVWSEGFGYADVENRVRVTTKTKFRIGSVSKTLTATAMMQLVEQGKLDLDKDVRDYLPRFPVKKHDFTTRQLAGHLAGIRHYKGNEFRIKKNYSTVTKGLTVFQDDPLLHPPGSKYKYSSHGYNLLSAVVEKTSRQDFLGYMDKNIFAPLHMNNTIADYNTAIIPHRTRFYRTKKNGVTANAPYVDNSYKWASGGFLSNAEDLIIFGNAMLYHKLLKPQSFEQLTTSQSTTSGKKTNYGMGWSSNFLAKYKDNLQKSYGRSTAKKIYAPLLEQKFLGHSGGSVGGKTLFWVQPDTGIVVVAMSNSNVPPLVAFQVSSEFVKEIKD